MRSWEWIIVIALIFLVTFCGVYHKKCYDRGGVMIHNQCVKGELIYPLEKKP